MTINEIVARLDNVKKQGNRFTAKCPAHHDEKNSLSINDDGNKILLHCHSGCSVNAVCACLNIAVSDLFQSPKSNGKPITNGKKRIVATYPYQDENGVLLFESVRYEPKQFTQRKPNGNGGFDYKLDNVRRVLYRLPELLKAGPKRAVFICEGEKDCDILAQNGLIATTNPQGALKWRDEFSDILANRVCYILPDNDDTGRNHALIIAKSLAGKAKQIKIVNLPDLPEKGDVADYLQTHSIDELKEAVKVASEYSASDGPGASNTEISKPYRTVKNAFHLKGTSCRFSPKTKNPKSEYLLKF